MRSDCFVAVALACTGLLLAGNARADDGLEEVVVTAQKRADPISKVPISITALTQETMDSQGVRNIDDIVAQTPGVSITRSPGSGAGETISIRGISSNAGASTTGVYVDDTAIQARNNAVNFAGTFFPEVFDLERVEVLRGPQGTLFGAGAEGGVVRFLSVQPSLTNYTGYSRAEVSATDHGTPNGELGAAFGGPIVKDVLGFRVSAWDRHDGGYVDRVSWDNTSNESKPDWSNTRVLRAALTYAPTSAVTITPSVQYQERYTHSPSSYWAELSNPGDTQFVSGLHQDQPDDDSSTLASLKVAADLGGLTFTSISSYFHRNHVSLADVSNTDTASVLGVDYVFPVAPDGSIYSVISQSHTTQQVITQELRLQNSDPASAVKWLAGAFFSRAKQQDTLIQPALEFPAVLEQATGISFTDFFGGPLLDGIYEYTGDERSADTQYALFGNVDWKFAEHWTATAGLRVSRTKIDYTVGEGGPEGPVADVLTVTKGAQTDHPVTPKVGLNWEPDDHNMLYASVAKGYRIGGVNDYVPQYCGADAVATTAPTYQSDTTVSYEVGAKSRPAGGRLQIDASVFHIDWKNIQQYLVFPCLYGYTANSGGAKSNGFDLSVNAQVVHGLVVGASVGYTHATYSTTSVAPSGAVVTADGQTLGQTPWTLFGYAEYSFHVFGGRSAYVRVQDKYDSKNHGPFDYQNPNGLNYDPFRFPNDAINELDVRTGLMLGGLELSVFVDNLANQTPRVFTTHQSFDGGLASSPVYTEFTVRPRTAGLTAIYRF